MIRRLVGLGNVLLFLGLSAGAAAAQDYLLVSSISTNSVFRYDAATGALIDNFASGGGLSSPAGLVINPNNGNLLVVGAQNNQVLQFNINTGAFMNVFTSGGALGTPDGIAYGPDGNLYVSGGTANNVQRFNGSTGVFINNFATGQSGTSPGVTGVTFGGPSNNLFIGNFSLFSNVARQHNGLTGAFINQTPNMGILSNIPAGVVIGPDNNLYVAIVTSGTTGRIDRFNGSTLALIGTFVAPGTGGMARPYGIAFGPDGNLYVASYGGTTATSTVKRYDGVTGAYINDFVTGGLGGLTNPSYILFTTSAIPEPATVLLVGGAALAAGCCWRWRRTQV
jgi:DNA-binding beta-propeller fold protein YncE